MVDWLIPRKEMNSLLGSGRMSVLKRAATDNAYSMDTCKSKFICSPPTLVQGENRFTALIQSYSPFAFISLFQIRWSAKINQWLPPTLHYYQPQLLRQFDDIFQARFQFQSHESAQLHQRRTSTRTPSSSICHPKCRNRPSERRETAFFDTKRRNLRRAGARFHCWDTRVKWIWCTGPGPTPPPPRLKSSCNIIQGDLLNDFLCSWINF